MELQKIVFLTISRRYSKIEDIYWKWLKCSPESTAEDFQRSPWKQQPDGEKKYRSMDFQFVLSRSSGDIYLNCVCAQRLHLEAVVQLKAFFFNALVLFSCAFILFFFLMFWFLWFHVFVWLTFLDIGGTIFACICEWGHFSSFFISFLLFTLCQTLQCNMTLNFVILVILVILVLLQCSRTVNIIRIWLCFVPIWTPDMITFSLVTIS